MRPTLDMNAIDLRQHIRSIPDFPKPGILFYDISTLLADAGAWRETIRRLANRVRAFQPDLLIGMESRGFLTAAPLAVELGVGFAMIRKRGKLPGPTVSFEYQKEYGVDQVEIQVDAVGPGQRVVLLDDLLATGGTAAAGVELLRSVGADVAAASFVIELTQLNGRERLHVPVDSLIQY